MLEKVEGRRKRVPQSMRWLDGITDLIDMSLTNEKDKYHMISLIVES